MDRCGSSWSFDPLSLSFETFPSESFARITLINGNSIRTLLGIDVEGFESLLIRGMEIYLRMFSDYVISNAEMEGKDRRKEAFVR